MDKINAAKRKYKEALTVYDPGFVGSVMLSCESPSMNVQDIIDEFEIELEDWIELYNQFKENCGFDYCEIEKAKKLIGKMKTCEIL